MDMTKAFEPFNTSSCLCSWKQRQRSIGKQRKKQPDEEKQYRGGNEEWVDLGHARHKQTVNTWWTRDNLL